MIKKAFGSWFFQVKLETISTYTFLCAPHWCFRFYSSQWQLEDGGWIFSYFTTSVAPILWVKGPMNMFIDFPDIV